MSRPYVHRSPEVEREILDRLARGESLRAICQTPGMPTIQAVCQWAVRDDEFRWRYLEARQCGAMLMVDDILGIVDGVQGSQSMAEVQAARTRFDARRWLASKILPAMYGQNVSVTHDHLHAIVVLPDNGRGRPDPTLIGAEIVADDNDEDGPADPQD